MKKDFLNKLCCPIDKGELKVKVFMQDENENILEALLTCTECKRYYPVVYGIPIMTPDEFREKELEGPLLKKWGMKRDIENSKPMSNLLEHSFIDDDKAHSEEL